MDGFGAKFSVGLGMILSTIEREIILLREGFLRMEIMRDSMNQNIDLLAGERFTTKKDGDSEEVLNTKELTDKIEEINLSIENLNEKLLEGWKLEKRVVPLNEPNIISLYKERFNKKWSSQESLNLANKNFQLGISFELNKSLNSIREFSEHFESLEYFPGYDGINMPHKKEIQEAIHINSIGYGRTAVLCVGRTIEDLVNKFLKRLYEENKISKEDYEKKIESKHIDKIGFLNGKFLTDEEFTKLKAFSFDRNKGGHLNLGDISNERAKTFVQQGIWLVLDLQSKIKKIKHQSGDKNGFNGKIFLDNALYPSLGPSNAEHMVIEFADFQCPYCALASGLPSWISQYKNQYGDLIDVAKNIKDLAKQNKIRFVYVSMSFLGQESIDAAQAALCANEQGKFWEFHEGIFKASTSPAEDTGRYSKENLKTIAKSISGLDLVKFNADLDDDKYLPSVQKIAQTASSAGISGTPTLFVDGQQVPTSWGILENILKV